MVYYWKRKKIRQTVTKEVELMRKLKLYLDTSILLSVIEHESKTREGYVERLFNRLIEGNYEAYISPIVIEELRKLSEEKKEMVRSKISEINAKILTEVPEVMTLARSYVHDGIERIFKEYNREECLHIAYAVVYSCDALVSWNFKKIVNFRATSQVRSINVMHRYKDIQLITPTMLVEDDEL